MIHKIRGRDTPCPVGSAVKGISLFGGFLGGEYLRGYAWDCLFAGIHFSFSGFFCAYGLSGISFLHNIVSLVCARLPLAYLASALDKTSLTPMGFAAPIGSLLSVVICLAAYQWMGKHPEKRKSNKTE